MRKLTNQMIVAVMVGSNLYAYSTTTKVVHATTDTVSINIGKLAECEQLEDGTCSPNSPPPGYIAPTVVVTGTPKQPS